MNFTHTIGRLLGHEDLQSIESADLSFGAPWAQAEPAWLFFGCLALATVAAAFYLKYQPRGKRRVRIGLAVLRAAWLSLLLLFLADPVVILKLVSHPRPLLWVLFDGTDSMAIEDEWSESERAALDQAAGIPVADAASVGNPPTGQPTAANPAAQTAKRSRNEYVQAWVQRKENNLLEELGKKYRLQTFLLERPDGVRALNLSQESGSDKIDPAFLASQLTTKGEVTALGRGLEDLQLRHARGHLAGVLMVSDFNQNAGPSPAGAASRLGVPVYTVGIGPTAAIDLAVDLQTPLLLKKAERATLLATLRHTGLNGRNVHLRVQARPLGNDAAQGSTILIGERDVPLDEPVKTLDFPFEPIETGRFVISAHVDPLEAEIVTQNNTAEREVNIRDDFLRLMFVEYEPTWEWRFIKEVFHRDQLVGMRGFRTYLRSADPKVRETNALFLPTLTPPRSEFFANDVIFLGDMPAATLSTRFCEMVREFVSTFGGGLVVLAGPRFGPGQLADTPLADMLPVVVDRDARIRDNKDFTLNFTIEAQQTDFMQLGDTAQEQARAWDNLGKLPWYQPVARLHPFGTALAVHPTDTTVDGKTPQPLIAIRRYGKGEVIYLGMDESWRLRRKYGEKFYRQFWGQMIHRLGLSHALGSQKRFVVRTDRQQYQADDQVLVTVEAYDAEFQPLTEETHPSRKLTAELSRPVREGDVTGIQPLSVPFVRNGLFEARVPVFDGGEYRVTVTDPVTSERSEVYFQVTSLSAERRSAVRNESLQRELASLTNARSYTLETADQFLTDFQPPPQTETSVEVVPIWNTWLSFVLVLGLMLGEWLLRKWVNLA